MVLSNTYRIIAILPAAVRSSITYRILANLPIAWRTATIRSSFSTLARWTHRSVLYRWLTAEPDPDVIVIDLRATYTVGPVIEALDTVLTAIEPAYRASQLRRFGRRIASFTRATPVRAASLLILGAAIAHLFSQLLGGPITVRTIAPPLALLALAAAGWRNTRSWADLRDSRIGRLILAVLTPPAPPDGPDPDSEPPTDDADDHS